MRKIEFVFGTIIDFVLKVQRWYCFSKRSMFSVYAVLLNEPFSVVLLTSPFKDYRLKYYQRLFTTLE